MPNHTGPQALNYDASRQVHRSGILKTGEAQRVQGGETAFQNLDLASPSKQAVKRCDSPLRTLHGSL